MTHVIRRLTAKNRDHFGTLRSVIDYGLPLLLQDAATLGEA